MTRYPDATSATILTVSRLNHRVKTALELQFDKVWLVGEISNFSQPASGHWYFTLKDDFAQIRCAMFRPQNRLLTFVPQNGQQILVSATITLYEARGEYQLIVQHIHPSGEGELQQRFERLKRKLAEEGLFDTQRKKTLPKPATCVGIITSATGAALHDILHILKRRDPSLPVIIYPTLVQGNHAPAQLVHALTLANQRQECDVLIVGRGGGTLEDLWAFNDEAVARAIASSHIPVISAVGHEVDVSIADFVADFRAPTPSAAAEIVSRDQQELIKQLQSSHNHLAMVMDGYLDRQKAHVLALLYRLQQTHPKIQISRQQNQLLRAQARLKEIIRERLKQQQQAYQLQHQRLLVRSPSNTIYRLQQQCQQMHYQLQTHIQQRVNKAQKRLAVTVSQLNALSPLATLMRGYTISMTDKQQIVNSVTTLAHNETLLTYVIDGIITSQITHISPTAPDALLSAYRKK